MEWISVKNRLPKSDTPVLACDITLGDVEVPDVCIYNGSGWYEYASPGWPVDITHWMELPNLPNND